jgi:hypothetical protein
MKFQKLVLPILILAIISLLYFSYFSPKDELGLFSDFDTNSNANKEIIVKILQEKGFVKDGSGGTTFSVEDRSGKQVVVSGSMDMPAGIETANRITLSGHYNGNSFHAHEVKIKD